MRTAKSLSSERRRNDKRERSSFSSTAAALRLQDRGGRDESRPLPYSRCDLVTLRRVFLEHVVDADRDLERAIELALPQVASEDQAGDARVHREASLMEQIVVADLASS